MAFLILILGSCRESEYVDYYPESASKIKAIDSFDKVDIGIVARLQAYNDSLSNNDESLFSINGMSSSPNVKLESSQKDILSSAICVLASSVEYWKVFGAQ